MPEGVLSSYNPLQKQLRRVETLNSTRYLLSYNSKTTFHAWALSSYTIPKKVNYY